MNSEAGMGGSPETVPRRQGFYVWRDDAWRPTADIAVRHLANSREAVLLEDTAYRTADGRVIMAERGFVFDGGSKPAATWILVGHPWAEYLASYVIHDWQRDQAELGHADGTLSTSEAYRAMAQSDRDFKESQKWILANILQRGKSPWDRAIIRVKYRVVQAHALYRAAWKAGIRARNMWLREQKGV